MEIGERPELDRLSSGCNFVFVRGVLLLISACVLSKAVISREAVVNLQWSTKSRHGTMNLLWSTCIPVDHGSWPSLIITYM